MMCASHWVSAGSRRSLPRPSIVAKCRYPAIQHYSMASIIQGLRRGGNVARRGSLPSWGNDSHKRREGAKGVWEPNRDRSDAGKVGKSPSSPARNAGIGSGRDAIRRPDRTFRVDQRPQTKRESWDRGKTAKALEGSASERQRHKLRRKLSRKAERQEDNPDDSGRQTRRKRFLDPDSKFGKKSMVYLIKHGGLGGAVNLPDPVHAGQKRPFQDSRRRGFPVEPKEASPVATSRLADSNLRNAGRPSAFRPTPTRQSQRSETRHQGEILELSSAGSMFVYGRSSVKAALEHGRRKMYRLYVYENGQADAIDDVIMQLAQRRRIDIKMVPSESRGLLDKMSAGRPHNGIVLEASPLPQLPVLSLGPIEESPGRLGFNVELAHQSREEEMVNGTSSFVPRAGLVTPKPFVLLLNNILDPGNLGALLRSAHYFGIDAVAITVRSSSGLSAAALKAASGAAEEVRLFSVASSVQFVQQSKMAGWKTYAAVPPPSKRLMELHGEKFVSEHTVEREDPLQHSPCLLVLGNEGEGLTKALKTVIDHEVAIAKLMEHTQLDSLNVSVAGALLCHSFVKGSSAAKADAGAGVRHRRKSVDVDAAAAVLAGSRHVEPQSERIF